MFYTVALRFVGFRTVWKFTRVARSGFVRRAVHAPNVLLQSRGVKIGALADGAAGTFTRGVHVPLVKFQADRIFQNFTANLDNTKEKIQSKMLNSLT